jgi:hypothetical protein
MDTSDGFSTGPRLSDAPQGDPGRQAVAALKGYAFQLYGSVLAWLELKEGEDLFLEVAEDYAVVAQAVLRAVQAKETRASGAVTLNTAGVREAINSFVDLSHLNPERTVSLRYFTTSPIGLEREVADRIEGMPGLEYWGSVARGADLAPLRARLLRLELKEQTRAYIEGLDDQGLRDKLVRRITWDCGQGGLDNLEWEIEAKLLRLVLPGIRIEPDQVGRVTSALVEQTLRTAVSMPPRRLSTADLLRSIKGVTHTPILSSDLSTLVSMLTRQGGGTHQLSVMPRSPWLFAVDELPLPARLVPRHALVDSVRGTLSAHGLGILTGSTGLGKTIIARFAAAEEGGNWRVADLRDLSGVGVADRLTAVLASLSDIDAGGIILDDLDSWGDDSVRRSLPRLVGALRRRNLRCLITSHRAPSPSFMADIGTPSSVAVSVPYLSTEEIGELIAAVGEESKVWSPIVQVMSGGGHPQLVQASIAVLDGKGWPKEEFANLIMGTPEIEQERVIARQRLIEALPDAVRALLYRLSIVGGQMDRGLALAVAEIAPVVERPGEALERLIGPWVDRLAGNQLRVSPLVANAGIQMLGPAEIEAVRHQIVAFLMRDGNINVGDLDTILLHAIAGKVGWALVGISTAVLRANESDLRNLADYFLMLPMVRTDVTIYHDNFYVSWMLRLAQFQLMKVLPKPAAFARCLFALLRETENLGDNLEDRLIRVIVLGKVLIERKTAAVIPRWIDLLLEYSRVVARSQGMYEGNGRGVSDKSLEKESLGLMFVVQCLGLQEIGALSYVFDRLDGLDQNTRDSIFAAVEAVPGASSSTIVNPAWLAEAQANNLVWTDAASRFYRMATQARAWGRRELALRCHTARSVMADEYGKEPESALAMLDEAASLLGPDPILARARAKILWGKSDYAGALPLLEHAIAELPTEGVVEKVFMLREGAICAAEVGDWARAQAWFWQGHITADTGPPVVMEAMSIGMAADAAVANTHLGRYRDALTQLAGCIERLLVVDPEASLKNAYVHRVVRHTILWVQTKITGEIQTVATGEPVEMLTGACSNPEPPEAIKALPLGVLEIAWYMLAKCDLALRGGASIARTLDIRIGERTIPKLEMLFRFDMVVAAIKADDTAWFIDAVVKWLDAAAYFHAKRAEIMEGDLLAPTFGRIPALTQHQRSDAAPSEAAIAAIRALAIHSITLDRPFAGAELVAGFQPHLGTDHPAMRLLSGLEKAVSIFDAKSSSTAVLSNLASGAPRSPEDSLIASIHLLELTSRVDYRRILEEPVARWIATEWTKVANTQQFGIANPRISGSAILAAVARSKGDLASGADIVLTALPAVKTRLHPDLRQRLEELRNEGKPKEAAA